METLMSRWPSILLIVLFLQFSTIITAKIQEMPHLSIKCGECPCVDPCSQQLPPPPPPPPPPPQPSPPPPPPQQYCNPSPPPPPQIPPPPPPRFVYVTGAPKRLYPSHDPFDLQMYSHAAIVSLRNLGAFLLILVCSAIQLMVFC